MPARLLQPMGLLCLSSVLDARSITAARTRIYGGYSFLSNSIYGVTGSHQPLNGWDASLVILNRHGLQFKADESVRPAWFQEGIQRRTTHKALRPCILEL